MPGKGKKQKGESGAWLNTEIRFKPWNPAISYENIFFLSFLKQNRASGITFVS